MSTTHSGDTTHAGEITHPGEITHSGDPPSPLATGCLLALGSALLTCLMLFINGSLVMGILTALASSGPPWLAGEKFRQFALFSLPVLLAIVQWMMIDYLRTRLSRRHRQ